MENYFATGSLAGVLSFPYRLVPGLLFKWVTDISENPLDSSNPNPRSFPQIKQYPRRKKGRRGLPAARLLRWSGRGRRGGLGDHNGVRVTVGDGRSRSVHARRRGCSSAARSPAWSRRDSSIGWVREVHGMPEKIWVQGIGRRLTG